MRPLSPPSGGRIEVAQHREVADPVAVAQRPHPHVLSGVHVDGRHPRVGRLEQRQPLRELRAVGLRAARLEHGQRGVLARLGRAEVLDRVAVARRHVQHAGLGIDGRAAPASGAEPGPHDGAPQAVRRIEGADAVRRDRLDRHLPYLGREIDEIVYGHALVVERQRPGRKRLGRPRHLALDVRVGRHRALLDGPHRLAGHPVEDEREAPAW